MVYGMTMMMVSSWELPRFQMWSLGVEGAGQAGPVCQMKIE
jgi:hypothetical protein